MRTGQDRGAIYLIDMGRCLTASRIEESDGQIFLPPGNSCRGIFEALPDFFRPEVPYSPLDAGTGSWPKNHAKRSFPGFQ
jgi:hypothetical protein